MEDLIKKLNKIKKEKKAVILAHIYQLPEIQEVADFIGDSLDLSKKAQKIGNSRNIIVFCGVRFMAETAAILNPNKKIIIPDINAKCPMADMIDLNKLKNIKSKYNNPIIISYINTPAIVKAESTICCTSSNAINVVKSVSHNKDIVFLPDRNLGLYVKKQSGINMDIFDGFCPTHNNFILPQHVLILKKKYPTAEILVHPECRIEVSNLADHVMSTSQICKYVKQSTKRKFIIGTEVGIIYKLKRDNPKKSFFPISSLAICPNMKKITLEKLVDALEKEENIISLSETILERAYYPLKKMLDIPTF
ncbi:MAG: quinolinate synthase NadA [Endomicrobium sp.]|jgi:quinolinate synthase|nr:quinolinate synthase NadA [Endomicrobium sp.]